MKFQIPSCLNVLVFLAIWPCYSSVFNHIGKTAVSHKFEDFYSESKHEWKLIGEK